jgi:hypothetical protein
MTLSALSTVIANVDFRDSHRTTNPGGRCISPLKTKPLSKERTEPARNLRSC